MSDESVRSVERLRTMRDHHGWPEPRTVEDLRDDPRVGLNWRNGRDGPDATALRLAAALILLVAEDMEADDAQPDERGVA